MASALPLLYSFRRCPYAMRARLALAVAGVQCELREVSLGAKPAAMLAASPKGTVPVLITPQGAVIEQSLDIMLWALKRNDQEDWLGRDEAALANMLALIARFDTDFKFHLDRYKYPQRYSDIDAHEHRSTASQLLNELEQQLTATAYLFGPQRQLADMAIAPFVRQFAHTDKTWFAAQAWPQVQQWLDAFISSPLFAGVMHTYTPWQEGQTPITFPPKN